MISKSDVLLLLTDIGGIEAEAEINALYKVSGITMSSLKFIHSHRPLEIIKFYEKLRRSYNDKHSKLYINIVRANANAIDDASTVLTTLSALLNQIFQYKCEDKVLFLKSARADEIAKVLGIYAVSHEIEPAMKLLQLFKADLLALETISGRRN